MFGLTSLATSAWNSFGLSGLGAGSLAQTLPPNAIGIAPSFPTPANPHLSVDQILQQVWPQPWYSPGDLDPISGDSPEVRSIYFGMYKKEPRLNAAIEGKVASISTQEITVTAADEDRPQDVEAAQFIDAAIKTSNQSWVTLIVSLLRAGCIFGWSVNEIKMRPIRHGRFMGKWGLEHIRPLNTEPFLKLQLDVYRNIVGVVNLIRGIQDFKPDKFVFYANKPLFGNPFGQSDVQPAERAVRLFREAYQVWYVALQRYSLPYMHGKVKDPNQRMMMEAALRDIQGAGWGVTGKEDEITVLNMAAAAAMGGFESLIDKVSEDIFFAVRGSSTPSQPSSNKGGDVRHDTETSKKTGSDPIEQLIAEEVCLSLNRWLIPQLMKWNYPPDVGLPIATLANVDMEWVKDRLDVLKAVEDSGRKVSSKLWFKTANAKPADPSDPLDAQAMAANQGGGQPGAGGAPGQPGAAGSSPEGPSGPGGPKPGGSLAPKVPSSGSSPEGAVGTPKNAPVKPSGMPENPAEEPTEDIGATVRSLIAGWDDTPKSSKQFSGFTGEWEESKHPRAKDGKFGEGGGGGSEGKADNDSEEKQSGLKVATKYPRTPHVPNGGGADSGETSHAKPKATRGEMTGAKREGKGKDAKVILASGKAAPAHIKPSMIPPQWTDVQVSLDPTADLQVTGRDSKGRPKAVYRDEFHMRTAAVKFARVQEGLTKAKEMYAENQANRKDAALRDNADCVWLMQEQATRPGSDKDTGGKVKAYGATTLEGRHVVQTKEGVRLQFIGKEGVAHDHLIRNPELAKMLVDRAKKSGKDGKLFETDYNKVSAYTKNKLDGGKFTPKDFRTMKATQLAIDAVNSATPPKTEKEYKAAVKEVAVKVSSVLGNRPQQALESYIAPECFSGWRASLGTATGK